jgi:predicted RNA-binding Zn ribbon-like protein
MARSNSHPKYSQFRFDTGSLSLDFVATVRHRGAQPRDLLSTPAALIDWFRLAGCSSPDAKPSLQDYKEARLLREAIYRTVRALIRNEMLREEDIVCINVNAAYSLAVPQINATSCGVYWKSAHPIRACLADIARDAAMVIGDVERHRLKMCDNQGCQMLFVDNSPANRRRWCAMTICGNREKIKMHRQRKRSAEIGQIPPDNTG